MTDVEKAICIMLILTAVVGWGLIEGALWLLSHIEISWSQS